MSFKSDLTQSRQDFINVVWPAIRDVVGGGEIIPIEDVVQERFAAILDQKAGCDYWQLRDDGLRGIAARVQYGSPWATFTIRSKRTSGAQTELQKRQAALEAGMLLPALTIQAYLDEPNGHLLAYGVCRTSDLISYVATGGGFKRENQYDGNIFVAVWWSELKDAGLTVGTYSQPGITINSRF